MYLKMGLAAAEGATPTTQPVNEDIQNSDGGEQQDG